MLRKKELFVYMVKPIKDLKTILHFKKGNYVYRYILVDRFKHTAKIHYGFDDKLELTEKEIWSFNYTSQIKKKIYY
jgi:hypothetical protein